MSTTKNGHNAYLKIPGLFIIWPPVGISAGQAPAELSTQFNMLTAEEQSFVDGLEG
jgi:hypothetical protein